MKEKFAPLALVGMLVLVGQSAFAQHLHPRLKSKEHTINKVLVLPPQVELNKLGMKGSEGMGKEAEELSERLFALVTKELQARKVEILPNPFTGQQTDEAKYALANLQGKYDSVKVQMLKKPKDITKGRFSLGDAVSEYQPGASADTLAFIRGAGTVLTGGKKAFGWLVAGPKSSGFGGHVAFVDARKGDVLALAGFLSSGDVVQKTEEALRPPMLKSFKKLPLPGPPPKK
jgi:hypothetical protein